MCCAPAATRLPAHSKIAPTCAMMSPSGTQCDDDVSDCGISLPARASCAGQRRRARLGAPG
jgi:hypothetical protein